MANGNDLKLEEIWNDFPKAEMDVKTKCIKDSFIAVSRKWGELPCHEHRDGIEANKRFRIVMLAMGCVIITVLMPIAVAVIDNWEKIFN